MADRSNVSTMYEKFSGGQFEKHLRFVLNEASKLNLTRSQEGTSMDDTITLEETSGNPEASGVDGPFMKYLRSCDTLANLRQQLLVTSNELHEREQLHSVRHIMGNEALEDRISIVQKMESRLKSVVANKDYFLDHMHASPLSMSKHVLPIHVQFHQDVYESFSELSNCIKNLDKDLGLATLDNSPSDMNDNLSAVIGMTETLLANMNKDVKMIKETYDTIHAISENRISPNERPIN